MIQKTKLKKLFNDEGIQMPIKTLNILDDEIKRIIYKWLKKTKESNIRRLTPELIWAALEKE